MAKRKKKNQKPGKNGRFALIAFIALLLCLGILVGISIINASLLRIRRAEVWLPDLPRGFDGRTVLYASDIDLCGLNDAKKAGELFERLQSMHPDMLILGGDYHSPSLLEILNRSDNTADKPSEMIEQQRLFKMLASFEAPLGKFAITAPEDTDQETLEQLIKASGICPLINDRTAIRLGGDTLWLAGICKESANLNSAGSTFSREDCVLVVAFSPTVLPILLTSEASDGGQWADLALCGHTHGGQILLFGRSVLPLDSREQRFLSGWSTDTGLPILVTQGVGCEAINLRLGSAPEVWLITLRRG